MVRVSILAGGWGVRLGPLTRRRPKPLLPLAGRRILDYTLEEAGRLHGVEEVRVVVDPRVLPLPGVPGWARAVAQPGPGVNSALRAGLEGVSRGTVVLSFTGYITRPRGIVEAVLDFYSQSDAPVVVAVAPISTGLETFGFARLGMGGRVEAVTRELEEWRGGRGYVFAGVIVGEAEALRVLVDQGLYEGLNTLAHRGLLEAYIWQGDWVEIAYPWDILDAHRVVLDRATTRISGGAEVDPSATLTRGVVVEEGAVIEAGAVVRGPAYIGRKARVRAGAVVGPWTVLEEGAEVGERAVAVGCHLYESAVLGPGSVAERAIIGEESTIGPLAVLEARPLDGRPPKPLENVAPRVPRGLRLGPILPPGSRIPPLTVAGPDTVIRGD